MDYWFYALFIFSLFVGSLDGADGMEWTECKEAMNDSHFSEKRRVLHLKFLDLKVLDLKVSHLKV